MPKPGAPRTTKPPNGSAARTQGNSQAQGSTPEEGPLTVRLSHDELAARAYTRFLARGGRHGDDWQDWFQAEADLRREREARSTPFPGSERPLALGAPRRGSRGRSGPGGRDA